MVLHGLSGLNNINSLNVRHGLKWFGNAFKWYNDVHGVERLNSKDLVAIKMVMHMEYMESPKWFNMVNGRALGSLLKPIYGWLWIVLESMVAMTIPPLNSLG